MGVITRLLNSRQSSTKIICLPPYLSHFCLYYIKEFPFKPCKFKSKLFSQPSSVDCNNTVQTMFAFVLDHLFSVTTATVSQSCWTRCDYTWRHDNTHFSCLRQTCPWVCLALHCYVCVWLTWFHVIRPFFKACERATVAIWLSSCWQVSAWII